MKQVLSKAQMKIWKAIQERAKDGKGWIVADLEPLAREGYASARDLLDPWGKPYVRTGCTCNSCRQRHLQLVSLGPDGEQGTPDDLLLGPNGAVRDLREGGRARLGVADRWERRREVLDGVRVRRAAHAPLGKAAAELTTGTAIGGAAGDVPVRVREFFPETLFVEPALITDEHGHARREVDLADSITRWRLSAFASSTGGALGSTTKPLLVFQDFFVDIDFPVALTQNDEVAVPVAVYNYLDRRQQVRLVAENSSWFKLLDGAEKVVDLEPGEVKAVYFPVRVEELGRRKFTVKALGSEMSDAVRREVEIVPDGKKIEHVVNGRLLARTEHRVDVPRQSIEGSEKLFVKFYPGVVCQLLEGMEGLLRLPGG